MTLASATAAAIKSALRIDDEREDVPILYAAEAAVGAIHDHCGQRSFELDTTATARTFRPDNDRLVILDDIGTLTDLDVDTDTDDDGTYDTDWTIGTDFVVEPANALAQGRPITRIIAVGSRSFPLTVTGRLTVQVTARWGWPAHPSVVKQAAVIQGIRLYRRPQSPEGLVGMSESGPVRIPSVDPDVARMLRGVARISRRYA